MLAFLPSILALDLNVVKQSSDEYMIMDLNKSVTFDLKITNNGQEDNLEFYNLLGFRMFPIGTIPIKQGETKEVEMKLTPLGNINFRGAYTFTYFIKGFNSTQEEKVSFKIVDLSDCFEVGATAVDPESSSVKVYIHSRISQSFENVHVDFQSEFFNLSENVDLDPYKRKEFTVDLERDDFKELMAGTYGLKSDITVEGRHTQIIGDINFLEKDLLQTSEESYGWIVNTNIIKKVNNGNTIQSAEVSVTKNIISRLFTSFNQEPNSVVRDGLVVTYTWNDEVAPGNSLEVIVKTNWTFPLVILLLIGAIVILVKKLTRKEVAVRKKVSFVKVKGGEFALKVSLVVSAREYVEKVRIVDRLPPLVKLYGKFGMEQPAKVDESKRRLEWNFQKLEEGERRYLTYVIYSKVGVLGRFALPSATAFYEKSGELKDSQSNRAFFVTESNSNKENY